MFVLGFENDLCPPDLGLVQLLGRVWSGILFYKMINTYFGYGFLLDLLSLCRKPPINNDKYFEQPYNKRLNTIKLPRISMIQDVVCLMGYLRIIFLFQII